MDAATWDELSAVSLEWVPPGRSDGVVGEAALVSNWAYMVMASLAWTLKAWFALLLPAEGRWAAKHTAEKQSVLTLEFKRFRQVFIELPWQIIKTGRRLVYRLLSWNRWLPVFFRGLRVLRCGSG